MRWYVMNNPSCPAAVGIDVRCGDVYQVECGGDFETQGCALVCGSVNVGFELDSAFHRANVTPWGVVFWLMMARTSSIVAVAVMFPPVFTMTCLLILVSSSKYSGVALVFVLHWTLVKPWLSVAPPL